MRENLTYGLMRGKRAKSPPTYSTNASYEIKTLREDAHSAQG